MVRVLLVCLTLVYLASAQRSRDGNRVIIEEGGNFRPNPILIPERLTVGPVTGQPDVVTPPWIPEGCMWGQTFYQDGDINKETCLVMQCNNGTWEYADLNNNMCGKCTVEGDPHFLMFDQTNFLGAPYNKYQFGGVGPFVITQDGIGFDSTFGVNAVFKTCNIDGGEDLSCVTSMSYYEPGVTVDVVLPDQTANFPPNCTRIGHDPSIDPDCKFNVKVKVDGRESLMTDISVNVHGRDVLIFNYNHIEGDANLFCMNVVGSQGLSVSLCQHEQNFAYLYILPMQTLMDQLYGLCNTYTGEVQSYFIANIGIRGFPTDRKTTFVDSWRVKN